MHTTWYVSVAYDVHLGMQKWPVHTNKTGNLLGNTYLKMLTSDGPLVFFHKEMYIWMIGTQWINGHVGISGHDQLQCFDSCLQVPLLYFHLCFYFLFTLCSQHSNLLNQARLTVLKSRDDHVKKIIEEAKGRLHEITKDASRWKKVIQDLIIQVWNILKRVKCTREVVPW